MNNRRNLYILAFIIILLFTAFEELKLRPWLLKHHITAFGIAGSLPNFLAPLILLFGSLSFLKPKPDQQLFKTAMTFTASLVLYEFAQLVMPARTFDINDIIASILGGLFGYALAVLINRFSAVKGK